VPEAVPPAVRAPPPGVWPLPACPAAPSVGGLGQPWVEPADPPPDCDPCGDAWPPDEGCPAGEPAPLEEPCPCDPLLDFSDPLLPLLPLAPLLPLLLCWDGKGDSLPLPVRLELWLVPGLPPGVEGADEGDDGLGGWGSDGVCVAVVTEQPASPSAQAMGQTRPWIRTSRMIARVSRGACRVRLPGSAGLAQTL
jgi:hypothetical protein